MSPDQSRLEVLLDRLDRLERQVPAPHERPILDVARHSLAEQIRELSQRLQRANYWRRPAALQPA
jgi:hypothetical protein